MKSFVRIGVLGAFIALAAAMGVVTSFTVTTKVDAQIPAGFSVVKTCVATNIAINDTTSCTIVVTATAAGAFAEPLTLTVGPAGPNDGRVLLLNGGSGAVGPDVDSVQVNNPGNGNTQSIVVNCTGATCDFAVGETITVTESIRGAQGGTTTETIRFGAAVAVVINPSVTVGPATTILAANQTNTIVCQPQTIVQASGALGAVTCNVDFDDNDLVNPVAVSSGTVTLTLTNPPAGLVFQSTGNTTATFRCQTAGPNEPQGCLNLNFVLQSNVGGALGAASVQVSYQPDLAAVNTPIVNFFVPSIITVVPVVVPPVPGALPPFITVITDPCTLGAVFTGATIVSITPGQSITCRYNLSDNEPGNIAANLAGSCNAANAAIVPASQCVSSGLINFSLGGTPPAGLTITGVTTNNAVGGAVTGLGTTAVSFRCALGGPVDPNGCDFFDVTFTSAAGGALAATVPVSVVYDPDIDAQNTPAVVNFAGEFSIVQLVAGFVQPAGLGITCAGAVAGPFTGPFPGQIGTINVVAVGILPGSIACQVFPVNAAGTAILAAPGTIEISTLTGTLLTAAGQLTTNLRIGCGGAAVVGAIGVIIEVNNCQGVQFQVLGLGVGFVDLRARYEPSTAAALAGIREVEGAANVAFVAPLVTVSLLLNPNPVVVGATGTATARFNRTFNCAAAFGVTIAAGTACIDPTTGLPIAFNFGSALNGSVVFTIDNTAIASWVDAVTSTPVALPQVSGFTGTAAQVIKRCGFFPTTGLPATGVPGLNPFGPISGPLANFFGGCDSADARYRGNIAGVAQVTATFVPDLPGAFGTNVVGLNQNVSALLGLFSGGSQPFFTRTLEVVAPAPSGAVALARGCNNVSPTVTEAAAAYAARVTPAGALVAIWEHQAATNTFRGFSPMAGAPNDLAGVTRLRPVFVCVSAAANLDQPPA